VIAVLAEYRARKQVKEMLRREGHKVSAYTAAEIKVMANVWAAMHRDELVADAREMISKSPELTKMYEREQRKLRVVGKLLETEHSPKANSANSGVIANG
jgi:hypothetical protein